MYTVYIPDIVCIGNSTYCMVLSMHYMYLYSKPSDMYFEVCIYILQAVRLYVYRI